MVERRGGGGGWKVGEKEGEMSNDGTGDDGEGGGDRGGDRGGEGEMTVRGRWRRGDKTLGDENLGL